MALSIFLTTFIACEQDAPEINFSQTTTVEMDFKEVINAINDMSLGMEEKLGIIKNAIESSTLSLTEKMDVLKTAIESQTVTLGGKLDTIESAVEQGIISVNQQITTTQNALINSLNENFTKTIESLTAVNKALTVLGVEEGIYPESTRDILYMHPTAWDTINKNEELNAAFARVMKTTDMGMTAKPIVISGNTPYPQGWALDDVKITPDQKSLRLLAQHKNQAQAEPKPVEVVVYTYSQYTIEAGIPTDQNYRFTGWRAVQYWSSGTNYYTWYNSGATPLPDNDQRYQLTHKLSDNNNRMSLRPIVYFGVAAL